MWETNDVLFTVNYNALKLHQVAGQITVVAVYYHDHYIDSSST